MAVVPDVERSVGAHVRDNRSKILLYSMRTRRQRRGGEPADLVNELTPQELEAIDVQQKEEVKTWTDEKEKPIKADMEKLRKLDGKARKAILNGIVGYNVAQRRLDNINPFLTRESKSKYPCGSVTCKKRGKKIKNALIELSKFDEHSLGEIGVGGFMVSTGNYLIGNRNHEVRPQAQSQGGSRRKLY